MAKSEAAEPASLLGAMAAVEPATESRLRPAGPGDGRPAQEMAPETD